MHLINNINAVSAHLRKNSHFIDQAPDIINGIVGGCIEFMDIKGPGFIKGLA
jgi:hypothetical protein